METEEQGQAPDESTEDPGDAPVTEGTETPQPASLPSDEEREGGDSEESAGGDSEEGDDEDGATDEDTGDDG